MKSTTSIVIQRDRAGKQKEVLCIRNELYNPIPVEGKMAFEYVYMELDEIVVLTLMAIDIHDVLRPNATARVITTQVINAQRKKIEDYERDQSVIRSGEC